MKLIKIYKVELLISLFLSTIFGIFIYNFYYFPKNFIYEYSFHDETHINKKFLDENIKTQKHIRKFIDLVYSNQLINNSYESQNIFNFENIENFRWVPKMEPTMYSKDIQAFSKLDKILMNYNEKFLVFDSISIISNENFPSTIFFKIRLIKNRPSEKKEFYDKHISILNDIMIHHFTNELIVSIKENINKSFNKALLNTKYNSYEAYLKRKIKNRKEMLFQEVDNLIISDLSIVSSFSIYTGRNNYFFNHLIITVIFFLILVYIRKIFLIDKRFN